MSHIIGRRRYAGETYPLPRFAGASPPSLLGYGLYAARPAPGNLGARYVCSDGAVEFVDDGTVWKPLVNGRPGTQPPLVSAFTALSSAAGATWTDVAGTIVSVASQVGGEAALLVQEKPATCELVIHVTDVQLGTNGVEGLVVRNSANDFFIIFGISAGGVSVALWSSLTNRIDNEYTGSTRPIGDTWLRFTDDGATFRYFIATDGLTWLDLTSDVNLANGGRDIVGNADQIGLGVERTDGPVTVYRSYDLQ